jgi:hypothetical protein
MCDSVLYKIPFVWHLGKCGSLFYSLSVTIVHSVKDRMTSEWWWRTDWTNIPALSGIQTRDLSVQALKAYASDHVATGTDDFDKFTLELQMVLYESYVKYIY